MDRATSVPAGALAGQSATKCLLPLNVGRIPRLHGPAAVHDDDHANQYERMRVRFAAQLQALRLLEDELRQHPKHGIPERAFLDKMAIAIDYLQQAMDVLVLAAQE